MYAKVIVDITNEKLDRVFEYHIPSELEGILCVGMEVIVPFGNGNREISGYIIDICEDCEFDATKVKDVRKVAEKKMAIEGRLVALAAWMRKNYGGTMIQALKTVLPIKKEESKKYKRDIHLLLSQEDAKKKLEEYLHKNQKARARLLAGLLDCPVLAYELATKKLGVTGAVIRTLEEQGVLEVTSEQVYRIPVKKRETSWKRPDYTAEQEQAIQCFKKDYLAGEQNTYLLHGVTGSGKTEVYMEMIDCVVREGKQAIVLIPEIALTFQTVMRFYERFGDRVSILNSRMSNGERYDQMMRARSGELDVMIGPRSALFTPFPQLGLIVIDEEHEGTYKSEPVPRYHARETAIERARLEGAGVVLGSATPSMEAYFRAMQGEYKLLQLTARASSQALPEVYVVDMREELKEGNRSIISNQLHELMEDRLSKGQQMMLFINRRGYAGFVSCRSCGYVAKCPHCDVALASHRGGRLVCHYCGYEEQSFRKCPECGSGYIGEFKAGTQQIEELVKAEFPQARVLRMDMDTTRQKDGHEKILETFANGDADILIGTQMIVKGHDFPKVTLVGILAADMSLYANDYRSAERTFQLLLQAAGRAGRGDMPGEVVIQTYSPEHYSIETAASQDYKAFYEEEIGYRELMGYPPAEHLLAIWLSCENEEHLEKAAGYLKQYAQRVNKQQAGIIGPTSPYIGKMNDVYRRLIYIRSESYDTLIEMKDRLEQYMEMNSGFQKVKVQFDFNPMNIF